MIITGARVCDAKSDKVADIRVTDGLIANVAASLVPKKGEEVLDARGLIAVPGIIDTGARLGESGTLLGQLESLAKKAVAGGVTTVALQPSRAVNDEIDTDYYLSKSAQLALCDILPIASATKNNDGNTLNNLSILFKSGTAAAAIESDSDSNILRRTLQYGLMAKKPIFVRCKDDALDGEGVMNDSKLAFSMGLPGIGTLAESSQLAKTVQFCNDLGVKVVVSSITCEESLKLLKQNPSVWAFVDLHHIILDESACEEFNSYAKNSPPLRGMQNVEALKKALASGLIVGIASGHTQVSQLTKDVAFEEASWGIESLQIMWPLLYTTLVKSGVLSLSALSRLVSYSPANILGLQKTALIQKGFAADLILFSPDKKHETTDTKSPYFRHDLSGCIDTVFARGRRVFQAQQ